MKLVWLGLYLVVGLLACQSPKEDDPTSLSDQIEFSENPDPVKRISGVYKAVYAIAVFNQGPNGGAVTYQEGNASAEVPDGTIKGGGFTFTIEPASETTVNLKVEGSSTNLAAVPLTSLGAYQVFSQENGATTIYTLRKSIKDPVILTIERTTLSANAKGFVYQLTKRYWVNPVSKAIYWGIGPEPTDWFYLYGDRYTVTYSMIRSTSK